MTSRSVERRVTCPFTVIVDSRENRGYEFVGLRTTKAQGNAIIDVPIMRCGLPTGDYSILELPSITIERKTLSDFFGSVARRDNFERRLERMGEFGYAAIVVEAEWSEILSRPPRHSKLNTKALARTVMAWTQRYDRVHWWFMPGRQAGEATTFRLLEIWWKHHREEFIQGENVLSVP